MKVEHFEDLQVVDAEPNRVIRRRRTCIQLRLCHPTFLLLNRLTGGKCDWTFGSILLPLL